MLITGDLGFMVMEPFREACPNQFINAGVAEQNMVAIATGLAEAGMIPFVYSIAPFAALRPFEFIRNGPVAHHLPVRIVGVGAGFDYGFAGPTHHALEDVAVMRTQRGLDVVIPADFVQTRNALQATWDLPGPVYYTLGKNEKDQVPGLDGRFERGRLQVTRSGKDAVILAMGAVAMEAAKAADLLKKEGLDVGVAVAASLSPAPVSDLAELLGSVPFALTAEAHVLPGGLGSLACEVVAEHGLACRVLRKGVARPEPRLGSSDWFYEQNGLNAELLSQSLLQALSRSAS